MTLKILPTKDEIRSDIEGYKLFSKQLNNLIKDIENETKLEKRQIQNVSTLQYLLDKHAKSYNKKIISSNISEDYDENSGSKKLYYDHDGILIYFLSRVTYYKGDCDTFYDVSIKIDGEKIVDLVYQ